ncbi:MAG: hypothetical protein ACP5O7_10580, partial [Phycisphaerae bacterium]
VQINNNFVSWGLCGENRRLYPQGNPGHYSDRLLELLQKRWTTPGFVALSIHPPICVEIACGTA